MSYSRRQEHRIEQILLQYGFRARAQAASGSRARLDLKGDVLAWDPACRYAPILIDHRSTRSPDRTMLQRAKFNQIRELAEQLSQKLQLPIVPLVTYSFYHAKRVWALLDRPLRQIDLALQVQPFRDYKVVHRAQLDRLLTTVNRTDWAAALPRRLDPQLAQALLDPCPVPDPDRPVPIRLAGLKLVPDRELDPVLYLLPFQELLTMPQNWLPEVAPHNQDKYRVFDPQPMGPLDNVDSGSADPL